MAKDKAFPEAEKKIEEARRTGATELNLTGMRLTELPESVAEIKQFHTLDVRDNELTEFPEWLGQLNQLQTLILHNNKINSVPESLGQLTQLQTLNLSWNQLTALPESLGQLTQLHTLFLFSNQLTALPESLGQLTQLQTLSLDSNQLTALPESLGQLTQLQTLNLDRNQLTALPESLGQLTQLQTLNLDRNQLTALPESLGQLTQLQTLHLSDNQLTALPESLGQLTQLQTLHLSDNQLTALPESLGQLTQLQTLDLSGIQLTALPESLGQLTQLQTLNLSNNQLTALPESLGQLTQLQTLDLSGNQLTALPESLGQLTQLQTLDLSGNQLTALPESLGQLTQLQTLNLFRNQLTALPESLGQLTQLQTLILARNPLNPELAAAYKQGLDALKTYLRAKAEDQIVLNEAKLILIGEGEVGKTSLLGALRGDEWVENRPTTHGVEVDIKTVVLDVPDDSEGSGRAQALRSDASDGSPTEEPEGSRRSATKTITFNGWDFGGQNIYRHTHQLFFTAPAVYLAVWNPRRGPEQCCVDEWIKMVRQRAYDETRPDERPRILVVATHGGPRQRSAHIDEQLLRDEFGDLIAGFHHVDSRPDPVTGVCYGLDELKASIAREAAAIPSVGRTVPTSWKNLLDALQKRSEKDPYIKYDQFQAICRSQSITDDLGTTYAAILNELGYLIHYAGDETLQDTVILKPEYISKAISYVLEDRVAKEQNGLVEHNRLSEIWHDSARDERDRYPAELHRIFLRLMDRFDLSYQVAMPDAEAPETSLVAQLVPGGRPEGWEQDWPSHPAAGDAERKRICRLVDVETGRPAEVEGLLYRLIVRLHRYSLGRRNYFDSRHWKTGMILDDGINGRSFIEDIAGDVHVTVRAAYPDGFLGNLCGEVRWLVDHFWKGLDCRLSVPCHSPCRGLHELDELVATKREGISKIRCNVCKKFYEIDSLLVAATPKLPMDVVLAELKKVRTDLANVKDEVATLDTDVRQMIGQANEQFDLLMTTLTDPAKNGPRLFSFAPVKKNWRKWFNPRNWTSEEFRLALWCEHSRLPLPVLHQDSNKGVYQLRLTRDWVKSAAPVLKVLSTTLRLALQVAGPATKLAVDNEIFASIEDQLDFGVTLADSLLEGGDKMGEWLSTDDETTRRQTETIRAHGSALRELHGTLKEKDPHSVFGGLAKVQNKRREFLWVHEQFVDEY